VYVTPDGRSIYSATDLVGFLACEHLTNLDRAAAAKLIHKPERDDPEVELLQKRGYAHEQRYIASLEAAGRRVTRLRDKEEDGSWRDLELRARETEEAIRRGEDVIFQATFFDGADADGGRADGRPRAQWRGHADFLLRVEPPEGPTSELGAWSYEVTDTKLAHHTRASALLQICSYNEQLARIQGLMPERMHVVLGGVGINQESFRVADYMAYYRTIKARFEVAVDESTVGPAAYPPLTSYPDPVEHCSVCRWWGDCSDRWRHDDALALVAGISRNQRVALKERGVLTMAGLGGLELPVSPPLERTSAPAIARVREQARLQVESREHGEPLYELLEPERNPEDGTLVADRGLVALPAPSPGDLFFDIEGDPFAFDEGLEYLFGIIEPGAELHERVFGRRQETLGLEAFGGSAGFAGRTSFARADGTAAIGVLDPVAANGHAAPEPTWHAIWSNGGAEAAAGGEPHAYAPIGIDAEDDESSRERARALTPAGAGAFTRAGEKQAFERLMDLFIGRLERDPSMHIYHYAPYEPTALKRLAGRHGTREEPVDRLLRGRVFVDLYRVVRQGVRVGAESYSIKKLEPLYKLQRKVELRDAGSSIVEFERYLEDGQADPAILASIEAYNRDDALSNWKLREWLEERRPEAERQFGIELPRPTFGDPEPGEELSEELKAVRELKARLVEGLPGEGPQIGPDGSVLPDWLPQPDWSALRTPAQQATWLLAQLLEWHRREDKSVYWEFYRLLGLADDELLTEKAPLAGLVHQGQVGTSKRGMPIHRYRFPRQEHSIGDRSDVFDPRTGKRPGAVVAVDDDADTIDLRRPVEDPPPHPTSLVPRDIVSTDAQRAALMRVGVWVAEHGVDSADAGPGSYRAARDLLLGLAPRADQDPGESLVQEGESGTDAARRLALRLDSTTLPVQGPPGSGKTWSGARMIVDLVRAGRKVGITSNSHKVISKLLEEACQFAASQGFELRAIQKADEEDDRCEHRFVTCTGDNARVREALAAGEAHVAAGTAWLWARADMEGAVDTLFVDEAGQMSLANVVAMGGSARNIVLLGDPQQLDQPLQGVHPPGADRSALAHFLGEHDTMPPDRGVFLATTWRLHPDICSFTSEAFYEDRLEPEAHLVRQRVAGDDWLAGSGTRWVPVEHAGNSNESLEEARAVADIVRSLLGRAYVHHDGREWPLTLDDIVIVSPYNAHRELVTETVQAAVGGEPRVGTVDRFQGQEAAVSIYSMATSSPEEAPRGMDFLYSLNRLNVATSRARALAIVVASPALLLARAKTPAQMRLANGLCRYGEMVQ
jgi:predicted RecB family nuclease